MSATSELLGERVRALETCLAEAKERGDDVEVARLMAERDRVSSNFASATSALREGKQLLKG